LVFQHAPLPTSPVDGGGAATPSPPAGRVGVGAMFKSHCKDTYKYTSFMNSGEAIGIRVFVKWQRLYYTAPIRGVWGRV